MAKRQTGRHCTFIVLFGLQLVLACNELSVESCPDPEIQEVQWREYDKKCSDKNSSYRFHCQQNNTGLTQYCSYCAVPSECQAGQYPRLFDHTVQCVACSEGSYQEKGKQSYLYRHPSCDNNWSKANPGEIECQNGSATENRKFKCDWTNNFIPLNKEKCECFTHDEKCTCEKKNCRDGAILNGSYMCVLQSATTTPTLPSHKNSREVIIAITVSTVIAVVGILVVCCFIRRKCKDRKRSSSPKTTDPDEDENMLPKGGSGSLGTKRSLIFNFCSCACKDINMEEGAKKVVGADKSVNIKGSAGNVATGDHHSGSMQANVRQTTENPDVEVTSL